MNFALRDVCSSVVEHLLSPWIQFPIPLQEMQQLWWKLKKPVSPIQ